MRSVRWRRASIQTQPRPNENPWAYFRRDPEAGQEQLAADLFDSLTRLIIVLLLRKMPGNLGDDHWSLVNGRP